MNVNPEAAIPVMDVLRFIRNVIDFPYPQICKHLVAGELLSVLETHGLVVPAALSRAVISADDDRAIAILEEVVGARQTV